VPQIPSTNQYAQISDLPLYGLPATALKSPALTPDVLNAALQAASAEMDSYFAGRYQLPFLTWDSSVTEVCCKLTAYHLLSVRGYNPASAADVNIRDRYMDGIAWLNKVQRQAAHPNVTPMDQSVATTQQPGVSSSSVVFVTTGQRLPQRGW
jgi:phage gp36-like protein